MQFAHDHPDILVYLILVVVEQVFLLAPGTWPYRYGVPVRFKPFDLSLVEVKDRLAVSTVRLHYEVDLAREEVCFRNVFPMWTWGPLFFTGQIQFEGTRKVIIRMAPLTSLGVLYLFLDAIGTFRIHSIGSAMVIAIILIWYYRWLVGKLDFLL